jgi:dienelactone hydrolase
MMVIHDWDGRDEFEDSKGRDVAMLGFAVMVADVYGTNGNSIMENIALVTPFRANRDLLKRRLVDNWMPLTNKLNNLGFVTGRQMSASAMGFCFGGGSALDMARWNLPVKSVISFHGNLMPISNSTDTANINTKIMVATGFDDPSIPPVEVSAFQTEMTQRNADFMVISYSKTVHGFTQKNGPGYNALSDARSWATMNQFLNEDYPLA